METALRTGLKRMGGNVAGVFKARRRKDRRWTDEPVIQFHVHCKLPLSRVPEEDLIPREIDGVPTDVIQSSPRLSVTGNKKAAIQGGLSIGIEDQDDAGTLGIVILDDSGNPYGITSAHVLLEQGAGSPTLGDNVLHPAINDGGSIGADRVGVPYAHGLGDDIDVASFTVDYHYGLSLYNTVIIPPDAADPEVDDILYKIGRSTGLTEGKVTGSGFVELDYSDYGAGSIIMELIYLVASDGSGSTIATSGDSGALWYFDGTYEGAGLHTAHSDANIAYATPFMAALSYVGFTPGFPTIHESEQKGSANLAIPTVHEVKGSMNLSGSSPTLVTRFTNVSQDLTAGYDTIENILAAAGVTYPES